MGINKIIEAGLGIIKSAGRTAHEQEAAIRAAQNAKVAEQMANLPPRNKKANEALGLYHPVGGGIKLSKPVSGMHATTVPDPKFKPPKIGTITPEQMVKEEAAIIPLVGDRAAAGRYLTHVGENELETPVRLTGGARYMDANYNPINPNESAAWESGTGRISNLSKQAGRAGEGGRPVYGMYVAGSGTNTDFNVMGANALIQQIPFSKITKKSEKAFDQAMREGSKAFPPIPDWPGIRSPLAQEMILDKSNGILRTKLFGTMGKEEFQSMGFPEVPGTRKAIIEPELLDVPTNQAGFRMARMDTSGRIIEDPIIPSDYPTAWAGQVAGKLDQPADFKDIWQTHHEARRLMGDKAPASGDYYSFSRAHPIQYADQEWLDKLLQQRFANERKIKTGEYKEGGEVDMPNDVDLTESDKKLHALIDGHRFKHAMKSGGKVESKIEGDHPDAKLHALIESRRKELGMAAGGQAFKAAMKAGATEAKPIGFDKGGASFGFFPHLKGKRSKQDPEAAKNVPVDVARGVVSGVLGAPGDIESLLRIPYDYLRSPTMSELVTGEKKSKTFAPTSEDIEKKLPFKSDTPVSRAATGAGQLAGGFYYGPGSPLKVIANLPGAIKHGATEFAKASAAGASRVVKQEGGNWMKGSLETDLKPLKFNTPAGNDAEDLYKRMKERYTPEEIDKLQEQTKANIIEQMTALENMVALNKWVDSNLKNYVKKKMGTPEDPVRKLAEEGIVHMPTNEVGINRYNAPTHRKIYGGEQVGQSDAAKAWEDAADVAITPTKLKDLPKDYLEPWMQNANPDTIISHLNRNFDTQALGFDHIIDVLKEDIAAGRIRPEQLNKVSMEQAVRRTSEYDQNMAKQMRETAIKQTEDFPVQKEYPEGYKWIELTKPKYEVLEENLPAGYTLKKSDAPFEHQRWQVVDEQGLPAAEYVQANFNYSVPDPKLKALENFFDKKSNKQLKDALDYEGKAMGHCVGSYCDEVSEGNKKIYTLRDAKGEPHVTIEVEATPSWFTRADEIPDPTGQQKSFGHLIMMERDRIARARGGYGNTGESYEDTANRLAKQYGLDTSPRIAQIKGKQNAAPKDEYLPYVQDFVKSGSWSDVGDLRNTGLKTIDEAFPNYEDAKYFANTNPNAKYVTQAEIDAQRKQINEELINEFGSHRIKPDPQSKTTYGQTDFMTAKELAELEFPGDLERQANMIRGAMQGTTEPGAFSGTIYPPLAEKSGGLIGMAEGGSSYHPDVQDALKAGRITPNQAKWMSNYYKTPGNAEIGTAGIRDGISEKMMNYRNAVRAGEYTRPNWMESIPKEVKLPKWFDGKLDLDREGLRQLDKIPGMTKKAFNASEYSNTFPAGVNDANYYNELLKASKENPDYQPYMDELNKLRERNQDIGKQDGGLIHMGPGGLIKNLLKMTAKEEALSKLPQMKAETAAKQALEAEYQKAMRSVPYDKQVTLKDWEATRVLPAAEREANKAKYLKDSKVQAQAYHGPGRFNGVTDIDKFQTVENGTGGAWFASNPDYAAQFGDNYVMSVHLNMTNPVDLSKFGNRSLTVNQWINAMQKAGVDTSEMQIKPARILGGANKQGEPNYDLWELLWRADDGQNNIPEILKKQGFDGILAPAEYDSKTPNYVVFEPTQVKSALGNRGTYDPKDPNISKAKGGLTKLRKQYA